MKTEIQGSLFILVNYYGPNTQPEQVKILKEIDNHLKNLVSGDDDDAKIIFGGDFNMYFDFHLDALGGSPKVKQDSCHTVKLIMSEFDLIDLWRVQNPTLRQFTWRRSNPRKMRRLDYLLIPNDIQFEVKSCEILAPLHSDHSPVFLKFKSSVDGGTKVPGHWKFNNSLVNDATFKKNEMQDLR